MKSKGGDPPTANRKTSRSVYHLFGNDLTPDEIADIIVASIETVADKDQDGDNLFGDLDAAKETANE